MNDEDDFDDIRGDHAPHNFKVGSGLVDHLPEGEVNEYEMPGGELDDQAEYYDYGVEDQINEPNPAYMPGNALMEGFTLAPNQFAQTIDFTSKSFNNNKDPSKFKNQIVPKLDFSRTE